MHRSRYDRVFLINPPNTILADSIRRIGEPLGLLYLAAALREQGYTPAVLDMAAEGYDTLIRDGDHVTYGCSAEDLTARLTAFAPDVVGVNCMFTAREANALDVCRTVRAAMPEVPIVVGGLHPSVFPRRFLESGLADYVILGEGEYRLGALLACLAAGREPDFDGVAYQGAEGIVVAAATQSIEPLDALPFPARDLVDMEKYFSIGTYFAPFSLKQRVGQILATRGCPNKCVFCSAVNFWGRRVRQRSVDNVIAEMRQLKEVYGVQEVQFVDDNLTFNKGFASELFRRMIDLDLKWCTPNGLMFNTLDENMIALMAQSGAYQLTMAIESGSPRVLREIIHKRVDLGRVRAIVDAAHGHDIGVHGMFVVGFPGERLDEIMLTLDFPYQADFDSVSFFLANPLPGSQLYEICRERNYFPENASVVDFKTPNIVIPPGSPDFAIDAHELLELVEVRTRQFNDWAKTRHPERFARKFKRFLGGHPEESGKILGRVT
jgi:anaerobic magnesium-protoporphyrin IX monomethyl ester cyclase